MAIQRDTDRNLGVGSVKAAKQADKKLTATIKYKPPVVKPVPLKKVTMTPSRPHQNIEDVTTGALPMNKIGDLRPVKLTQQYAPIRYETDPITGETKALKKTVFAYNEETPTLTTAKKLYNNIKYAKPEEASKLYGNLNDYGKKTFWSYVVGHGKIDQSRLTVDMQNDMKRFAGAEYSKVEAMEKAKTAELADLKAKAQRLQAEPLQQETPTPNEQKLQELMNRKQATPVPSGSARQLTQGMTQSTQESRKMAQDEVNRLAQEEINRVINTPQTGVQKFARSAVSGLTAGLSEAGMTPEQKLAYMKAMSSGTETMRVSPRGEAVRTQQTEKLSAYGAGQFVGNTVGALTGEGLIAKAAGVEAKQLVKKGVISGVVGSGMQGVQSGVEGKNAQQIAKDMAIAFGLNVGADIGLNKLLGIIGKKVVTPEIKVKLEQNGFKVMDNGEIYKDGVLLKKSAKISNEIQTPDVIADAKPLQLAKGTSTTLKTTPSIIKPSQVGDIQGGKYTATKINIPKSDKLYVSNKPYAKAVDEYNSAIEEIQNHFMTNELRQSEVDRILPELGIDINKLASNLEKTQTKVPLSQIGSDLKMKKAVGIGKTPSIRKTIEVPKAEVGINYPKGERTNVNQPTLSEAYALRKNQPPTIVPKQLKQTAGMETLPNGENVAKATTKSTTPITDVNEAIKFTKSKISTEPLVKKKGLKENLQNLYQGTVSTNAPIERIGRMNLPGAKQLAQQAQNLGQTSGTVDYTLEKDLVGLDGVKLGKGLNDSIKHLNKKEQTDLWDYMYNEHNIDRMKQDKPVFGLEIPSETSSNVVKMYEKNPKLKEARDNVRKIIDTVTDEFAVKTGLVSKEAIDNIRNTIYRAYIPTYRVMDKEALQLSKVSGGKFFKGATGSSKDLLQPEQQVAAYINKVIRAGRKNEMYNNLFDLVQKNPEELAAYAQISKTTEERIKSNTGDILNDAIDSMDNNAKKIGDKYQFTLYKNGEPVTMDVSEQMYKALNNATDDSLLNEIGNGIRKYATGPMKALITGYNPLFAVTNYMRDLPTALLYSTDAIKWSKNYPKAIKEIASNGELWKQYQALGGTRSGLFSYEKGVTLPANRNLAQNIGKGAVDTVGAIGNITEVLPRFTEYLTTIEKMGNNLEGRIAGIYNAGEITTPFHRSGKLTKQLDAFVPYLNPAVQGIDRFYRAVRYNPIKTIAKGVGLMTVPTLILESINSKDPAFKEMNQRTKDAFYLIPNGKGEFIKVPKSRENAVVFSTLFEWLARASKGEKVDMQQAINTLKTNFSPGDPINSFVLTPLLKTYQQIANPKDAVKNYANMDIVPSNLRNLEQKYQYDATTRELSKAIGEKLNVSPKVLDYLIDSYTGVIGQATRPSTTKTGFGSTVLNKFKADPVFQNDNINKLYNLSDKLTTVATTKNFTSKIDSKIVTPEEARKNAVNKVLANISDLRKEMKAVESLNISMEEKKAKTREIQTKMNRLAGDALVRFSPNKKP